MAAFDRRIVKMMEVGTYLYFFFGKASLGAVAPGVNYPRCLLTNFPWPVARETSQTDKPPSLTFAGRLRGSKNHLATESVLPIGQRREVPLSWYTDS